MLNIRKIMVLLLALLLAFACVGMAEATDEEAAANLQRLDATYTLALNAISKEDYATARKYLNIAFVYCDRQTNPVMYADLLLKQACLDVIDGENDIALLSLDAALTVLPDLADAYLVRTQIYTEKGDFAKAVENLEKNIELSEDTGCGRDTTTIPR